METKSRGSASGGVLVVWVAALTACSAASDDTRTDVDEYCASTEVADDICLEREQANERAQEPVVIGTKKSALGVQRLRKGEMPPPYSNLLR